MGVLSDEFYRDLAKQAPKPVAPAPAPVQQAPTGPAPVFSVQPQQPTPTVPTMTANSTPTSVAPGVPIADRITSFYRPVHVFGDLTEEQQIKKYGGVVGSPEYYANKADRNPYIEYLPKQLLSSIGVMFPDDQTWDKMSNGDKIANLATGELFGLARLVASAPREIVKAPIRLGASIAQPWVKLAKGQTPTFENLAADEQIDMPWLGKIPTYFQSYDEARKSGMGPVAATLFTGGTAAGDVALFGSLAEAGVRAMQPRGPVTTGGTPTVQNVAPVRQAIIRTEKGMARGVSQSSAEYYTIPESVAKQFGGAKNNTYFKVTPASDDSVEISVVQTRGGALQKGVDWLRGNKTYEGDFGPEVKIQSQVIRVGNKNVIDLTGTAGAADDAAIGTIPSAPIKGLENKPVTPSQLANLSKIGEVNGIAPNIRDAVIRTVTRKSTMGEMTQAEYVKAAQTLGLFNNASKYVPKEPWLNPATQYISPQRRWMRTYEEKSGIPLYSEAYVPMEEAVRVRDVFRDVYRAKSREVFGKYQGSAYGAERSAISAYMRGQTDAIVGNPAFSAAAKNEMIEVATKLRALYDEVGPQLDVPAEIFLKDYQPNIQNIGGIYQMYKEGAKIPKELEFFAKFKKRGNFTAPQIDDSLALFDIYVNSGSNRMFLNPALERISAMAETLPDTLKGSVRSYVLEKMGYAGRLEQALDDMIPAINKKMGFNLPPDAARQMSDIMLSTQYSGLLSSPATWFRQMFQYPLFGYSRLGPKFMGEAYKKALTKEGLKQVSDDGFFVDLGVPYGEELTKDITLGGAAGNVYKKATQIPIAPNSWADNIQRSVVYHQFKMQFDDALARYNAGKISWAQLEKDLDFAAFSPVDQNIARQAIVAGKTDAAFKHLVRDVIDETNFPYRKAATGRIGYGLGGKLGTSLLQWPVEAAHTLGHWAKTGQWDKMIRWAGASVAIQRTFEDTFGVDFTRSMFLGPFNNVYSPFVQAAKNTIDGLSNAIQNNRQAMNENKDKVVSTLRAAGMPAGVQIKNVQRFWKSYQRGNEMIDQGIVIDPAKPYPAVDDKGEVRYYTDFAGLFWGELMGFPVQEKEGSSMLLKDMRNAQYDRSQVKARVMELYQQEKYDEAAELMAENGITVTPQDFDDYYIPLTERTFQSLPSSLRAQFAPQVYPESVVQ